MIVQIRNASDELIETLMHGTGSKTASGAFIQSAALYLTYQSQNEELRKKLAIARTENIRLRDVIESARFAAAALIDKTAQQDLDV